MTLWMLLFAIASLVPVLIGFQEGNKVGPLGALCGFIIGLAIGVGWFFGLLSMRRWTHALGQRMRKGWDEVFFTVLYICFYASGFVSGYLSLVVTRFVLRQGLM